MNEKASIIMSSYNSFKFIDDTIQSILNQTYTNWELLITDDCSTDGTLEIINNYVKKDTRIKVFKLSKNSGPGVARNNSIKQAKGRFIAFCDSDDLWKPEKLEKQIKFMLENDVALSFSSYDVIDEEGNQIGKVDSLDKVTYKTMLRNNYIGCLTAVYDTRKLGKIYMPEVRKRQDWALWLSILKKTDYALGIKKSLAIYRDRRQSISENKLVLLKYNWAIYHKIEGFSKLRSSIFLLRFMFYYFAKKFN